MIEWQHPLFFLLIAAAAVILLLPRRLRWFLRTAAITPFSQTVKKIQGRMKLKNRLPYLLMGAGLLLLIVAAADPTKGHKELRRRCLIHTYLIIDDGSGSMVDYNDPRGIGKKISALLAGNRAFLEAVKIIPRPLGEKDMVGAILFSSDAFILAYPDVNYDNLWLKLNEIDWKKRPLASGTELNKALWAAIRLIVQQNRQAGKAYFTAAELESLQRRVSGADRQLNLPPALRRKTETIAKEIIGTSFVVFTDGQFTLDPYAYPGYGGYDARDKLSAAKNLLLCKQLGIRVYLITAEARNEEAVSLIKATGGGFYYLKKAEDVGLLKRAYLDILRQQANEFVIEGETVKISYYFWPALIGFSLIFAGVLARYTISRSLITAC